MGSASSKFKKYLTHGDEFAAMQIYQSSPELRKNFDPNLSFGDGHNHNTALHYAAKHGMKHLLRTFLNDLNGNPNKKNSLNETVLHCACQLGTHRTFSAQERRATCVTLLLQWKGVEIGATNEKEKIDITAQDCNGNTALHAAAAAGLERCVELLLNFGAPLFCENKEKLTPCDIAMQAEHHQIARLLESRMVFADNNDAINEDELYTGDEEVYSGLRTQDLQEAKDLLSVETSDMLNIPLFTAEALLRDNEWSREALLEKWIRNPVECCEKAGVEPPVSAWQQLSTNNQNILFDKKSPDDTGCISQRQKLPLPSEVPNSQNCEETNDKITCDICLLSYSESEIPTGTSCNHKFCYSCWRQYLSSKIQEGNAHSILCPAFHCHILIAPDFIDKIVPADLTKKYLHFDIKAFVENNPTIKWCPMAGCGRAVRLPETEYSQLKKFRKTSRAVDCGNGHFFCWDCLGEAHAPCECSQWKLWLAKIAEIKPERLQTSNNESEDAANCLWLVTNSKPCPNCKSPIQKNEGCNHMKCSKCKFDFCWVCQESWKKHGSATGGYFRCNRFEAMSKADEKQDVLISEAMTRNQQTLELSRFLHYYTRFRNHENSRHLEEPFLVAAQKKMATLASSLKDEGDSATTKFVEDAIRELLKARRVLCGSYVYGYYLEDTGYNKTIFELMQNELEEVTERLSELVARPYLRTPKPVIIQTACLTRRKRHEFSRAVSKGLIPPDIIPLNSQHKRKHRLVSVGSSLNTDQLNRAIEKSLKELKPESSWLRSMDRVHNNLTIYDLLENSDEELEAGSALPKKKCKWTKCEELITIKPAWPTPQEYCSLNCARLDSNADSYVDSTASKYNMDLVIAMEMSRLQMIEDQMKQKKREQTEKSKNLEETPIESTASNCSSNLIETSDPEHSVLKTASLLKTESDQSSCRIAFCQEASADLTVDYFLKSLACKTADMRSLQEMKSDKTNQADSAHASPLTWWSKSSFDKQFGPLGGWKVPNLAEDGRFRISDIHEAGVFNDLEDSIDSPDLCFLKRSRSTGDLIFRCGRLMLNGYKEPCYHLDSDHSSHDERPEDEACRLLISCRTHHNSAAISGAQTSLEDTTTSDSFNADFEVCDILGTSLEEQTDKLKSSVTEDSLTQLSENPTPSSHKRLGTIGKILAVDLNDQNLNQVDFISSSHQDPAQCSVMTPKLISNRACVFSKSSTDSETHGKSLLSSSENPSTNRPMKSNLKNKKQVSRSIESIVFTPEPELQFCNKKERNLSINTAKVIPVSKSKNKEPKSINHNYESTNFFEKTEKLTNSETPDKRSLELDSSNDYESETGIPKSPTLFISGVSISRTPEPKSPALSVGRQLRSSSLSVPPQSSPLSSTPLSSSAIFLVASSNSNLPDCTSPSQNKGNNSNLSDLSLKLAQTNIQQGVASPVTPPKSPKKLSKKSSEKKSKSANTADKDCEVFHFMKSSTDGALSSVLHIQESNLSSDDFHEALFLLERSPKMSDSKRRKKSKKNRLKDKENSASTSKLLTEASSAL